MFFVLYGVQMVRYKFKKIAAKEIEINHALFIDRQYI